MDDEKRRENFYRTKPVVNTDLRLLKQVVKSCVVYEYTGKEIRNRIAHSTSPARGLESRGCPSILESGFSDIALFVSKNCNPSD